MLYYKKYIKYFSVLIYSYINTRGNWAENSKLCENTKPINCISTRKMFYILYLLNVTYHEILCKILRNIGVNKEEIYLHCGVL